MAKKISQLPTASTVDPSDTVIIVDATDNATKRALVSQLGAGGGSTPGGSNGDLQINASGSLGPVRTAANGTPTAGMITRHNGARWEASDDVAELPNGMAAGDLLVWTGSSFARLAKGTDGQILTVVNGALAWADPAEGGGGGEEFDLASLPWSVLLLPNYTGSPWISAASAGTSADREFASPFAPTAGTQVNGHTPALFQGTSNRLASVDETEDLLSASAYTVVFLVKLKSPGAIDDIAQYPYEHEQLIASSPYGQQGISWSVNGVRAWHSDANGIRYKTPWKACSTNTWAMVAVTFGAGTLAIDVNESGSPETISAVNLGISIPPTPIYLQLGVNYANAVFTEMELMVLGIAPTKLSGVNLAGVKSAFETILGNAL